MAFRVRTQVRPGVTGPDPTVYLLEDEDGGRAEVWPALGFNCYRWHVVRGGEALELLYADPALFADGRPTRSGIPVLFPFPNRIRDGAFTWEGARYQLPLNDPAQKNAIHGFACRRPWRVLDQGGNAACAWLTGAFRCSLDAPDCLPLWPADHEIRVTYRLGPGSLRVEAEVRNPDTKPLPFGLGYHPYLRLPFVGGAPDGCLVTVPAGQVWPLAENLPAGPPVPVDGARDLNHPRPFGRLEVDDVLTGLPALPAGPDGLVERARVEGAPGAVLRLLCAPDFRELVVYTPPHRQAFCVEPYTCTTDAVHLQGQGVDAGWRVLPPGERWAAAVELRV